MSRKSKRHFSWGEVSPQCGQGTTRLANGPNGSVRSVGWDGVGNEPLPGFALQVPSTGTCHPMGFTSWYQMDASWTLRSEWSLSWAETRLSSGRERRLQLVRDKASADLGWRVLSLAYRL